MTFERNSLLKSILPAGALGFAAFTLCTQPVNGFFPPVPTGKDKVVVTVPPVSPPPVVVPPVVPPVPPPPFVPPPVPPVPPPPPPVVVKPTVVPEPATIVTAGVGLALVVGLTKRGKKKDADQTAS